MEALLGAGQSNPACGSVADLQAQLRDLLHNRVAETRADHTSVTFEIRATAIFDLPITETENEAPEGVSNIDPLLGGARSNAVPAANGNPGQPARRVNAIDALVNQPVDDPALQTTIARHIILSLRAVDSSNWTVRQVSRTEQGWTFTYICKDSWQAWNRQAYKTPAKTAIGEWSEKGGQDPVHLARPAFDCRGSVKIAFSKATKTIDVKYEHTPIHKTVAELIELLAPPPIAPIIKTPAKKVKEPKAPKEPRPPKEPKPKTLRSSKKRVGEDGIAAGEGSQPKRSRKKKDSLAPIASNGAVLPPEMPGALPVGDPSARQLYNTQTGTPDGPQPRGSGSYPEGLVNAANDASAASINSEVHAHSILNLPPGEAARRREVAIKLLSDNNLDPKTLSAEQFNIFANQSPDLQNDSLAMLLEYGAERLRIVHPTKEASNSGQSTPNANNASPVATGAPQPVSPKKSRKSPETEGMGAGETQKSEVGEGRQRRICDNCRIKKYKDKCDKAKPSCSMCVGEGVACVYPLSKPRQSKAAEAILGAAEQAGAEIPNDEPDGVGSSGLDTAPVVQPAEEPAPVDDLAQEHYDGHLHQTVNVQVPETTVHQAETPSDVFNQVHGIYQHPSGLSFPQVSATSSTEVTQPSIPSTVEQGYMPNPRPEVAEASLHGYTQPRPSAAHQKPAPTVGHGSRGSSGTQVTASRRSLPAGQPSNGRNTSATTDNQNGWQSMSSTPAQATRTSPRQARVKKPVPVSKAYDDSRQQPGSAWGNVGQSVVTQPTRNSPIQAAVQPTRATSRQNNRSPPTAAQPTSVQPSPAQDYSYTQYQSGNTQAEPSGERVSYQPYSNQTSNQPSSYSTDSYDARISNTTSSTYPAAASQNVASSYSSNPAATTSTAQWSASTSTPQSRNTHAYSATQSAVGGSSYHAASNPPQSQALQGFNVRPPPAQPRASSSAYNQQLQQHQKQQHGQQHSQQQAGYNGYVNNMSQHQQPQQQAGGSHQSWGYGFGATANNAASSYNSAAVGSGSNSYSAAAGTSHGHGRGHGAHGSHGHPAQQQRSMDLSSHTYSSMDGEQSLYDLLRTNPAG